MCGDRDHRGRGAVRRRRYRCWAPSRWACWSTGYRFRVLIAATVAGATIAFLIAGMGGFMTVINCAYIGLLTGIIKRRGRGTPTVLVVGLVAGAVFGAAVGRSAVDSGPAASPDLRIDDRQRRRRGRRSSRGISNWRWLPDMDGLAERLRSGFATALNYWPFLIGGSSVLIITVVTLIGWWASVAGDQPARRDTRRAQARLRTRHRTDRARSGAAHRRPVPLSRRATMTRSAR